jgi:hypothetical protein
MAELGKGNFRNIGCQFEKDLDVGMSIAASQFLCCITLFRLVDFHPALVA